MKREIKFGEYFYGNKISDYGLENGYVDYRALAKSFDCVLNNTIMQTVDYWDLVNGSDYDEDNNCYIDIFQFFIISEQGFNILSDYTDEIVYYSEKLDMYLWGVTHCGTAWDYVLTDIPCKKVD